MNLFNREKQFDIINNILLGTETGCVPSKNPSKDIYELSDLVADEERGFIVMAAKVAALNELCEDEHFAIEVWKSLHEVASISDESNFNDAIIDESTPVSYGVYTSIATKIGIPVTELLDKVNKHTRECTQEEHLKIWSDYMQNTALSTYSRLTGTYMCKARNLTVH